MTPNRSRLFIGLAVVTTAALIVFAPKDDTPSVSEAGKTTRLAAATSPRPAASSAQALALEQPRPRQAIDGKVGGRIFGQSSWVVVPPPPKPVPPAPPPPPPPPTAPPLPYTFMGRFEQGDTNSIILTRGNRVVVATQGEVLENMYRVDRIEPNKVTFTYLPLGTLQYLSSGSVP